MSYGYGAPGAYPPCGMGEEKHPPPPYAPSGGASFGYPGMAAQIGPFHNPAVPFSTPITPLQDGSMILIQGNIPYGCSRFSINLKQGASDHSNNAFHFNPRFEGTNQVVRNSSKGGSWGAEERHGGFPFVQGQNFEIIIMVAQPSYKVAVNGQHFTEYKHRLPKEAVTHLYVDGNVTLTMVRLQSPPAPAFQPPAPVYQPPAPVSQSLAVPYTGHFPYGLQPGKTFSISGTPHPGADRFTVDFQTASGDIAFHFNPRFKEGKVVRNTCTRGTWGSEEKQQSYFPFQPGVPFTIIGLCEKHQYKIAVNGTHFIEFRHRIACKQVRSLLVSGDVTLTNVQV